MVGTVVTHVLRPYLIHSATLIFEYDITGCILVL